MKIQYHATFIRGHLTNTFVIGGQLQVDLFEQPGRKQEMMEASDNNATIPQLHVNGTFIGRITTVSGFDRSRILPVGPRGRKPLVKRSTLPFPQCT